MANLLDFTGIEVVIAAAGVIGSWAVLRATVAELKSDVKEFRASLVMLKVLEATGKAHSEEIDRVRSRGHDHANAIQSLGERMSKIEGILGVDREITPIPPTRMRPEPSGDHRGDK